jgi:hypothetical protein
MHVLTCYDLPKVMYRSIRTTNAIESFLSNVRSRTDQIDAFPTEMSCLTIVWAVMPDIRVPKIPIGYTLKRDREPCLTTGSGGDFLPLLSGSLGNIPGTFFLLENRWVSRSSFVCVTRF